MRALHVGCGHDRLPPYFGEEVEEVRVDIDPAVEPDVVTSMLDLGPVPGEFDLVWSSHCLEHVFGHEVPQALAEFLRVLKPGGSAVIFVPDLADVRPTEEVLYESPAGPITGLDIIFGHRTSVAAGREFMAHRTGFTSETLEAALREAGFAAVTVKRLPHYNLMATATKGMA